MSVIRTKDAKIGMKVKSDIFSKAGQLIIHKDSILNRQMISHLKYYYITQLEIYDDKISHEILEDIPSHEKFPVTKLERMLQSKEYEEFKEEYVTNVHKFENNINDVILRNVALDTDLLIDEVIKLFNKKHDYFSFFGMLYSMKQIDDSTFAHCLNVAMLSRLLGTWVGLEKETLDLVTLAGLLHDIGKCPIPDEILMTPRKLTNQEYEFMKMHAQFGYDILKNQDIDERVKLAVLRHHERCDGSGYPFGLNIGKLGDFECIVSIADVYDAMTSDRCYRNGLCPFEVISFFEEEQQKYHPIYINVFLQKIATSYLNCEVLLNNGEVAKIVYLGQRLTRPVVQLQKNHTLWDLEKNPHLYIQSVI